MRSFAEAWTEEPIVQQLAAQLPWGHHMVLLDRLKDQPTREWYVKAAVEHGWSRNVLVPHISTRSGREKRSPISPAPCLPKIRIWRNRS
jgi:predicted nuclease of restriction endonuclease-like (RecB) superfamily